MNTATATKKPVNLKTVVDKLGRVKAQLSDLKEQETALRDQLVEAGVDEMEGKLFRATVSTSERTNIAWKDLMEEVYFTLTSMQKATYDKLLKKHTEVKETTTVKVVSR